MFDQRLHVNSETDSGVYMYYIMCLCDHLRSTVPEFHANTISSTNTFLGIGTLFFFLYHMFQNGREVTNILKTSRHN